MKSKDQSTQSKAKSEKNRSSKKNLIRQIGSEVQIGNFNESDATISHTINCRSPESARQLALELSGSKPTTSSSKQIEYTKLHTHPWYGVVILEELTETDRNFISLYIQENVDTPARDFKLKVHRLFIDDPNQPINHALIQEILSVIAFAENSHE